MEEGLHMNGGVGETSYAMNSMSQKQGLYKLKPMLEESLKKLYSNHNSPKCLKIADLGCSSGPNTLLLVQEIIDIIDETCQCLNQEAPMFQVFLNDLPRNDFNAIFRSLPSFNTSLIKEKGIHFGPCFIAAMPGTFYGRLFPDNFLHFVHSSYSLHWLSQVPEILMTKSGAPLNKGNIYMATTSPHIVQEAYLERFERDFKLFLKSRSEEMIPGGHMVLTIIGSETKTSFSETLNGLWHLLGTALHDMVLEGLIEEAKLDEFNIPFYAPTPEEVKQVIQSDGSFRIQRLETFKINWDANTKNGPMDGKIVATSIRAVAEALLADHFTNINMDDLFERFANKITSYLQNEKGLSATIAISLTKD